MPAAIDGPLQWCNTFAVPRLKRRAASEQRARNFHVSLPGCHVQRGSSGHSAAGIHVRTSFHQDPHDLRAGFSRKLIGQAIQRRVPSTIQNVWIHRLPQEQSYHFRATSSGREMQKCLAKITPRGQGWITLHRLHNKADEIGTAAFKHARQQSNKY